MFRMEPSAIYWIALQALEACGVRNGHRLLRIFGTPEPLFQSDRKHLELLGLSAESIQEVLSGRILRRAEQILHRCEKCEAGIWTFHDPSYPHLLKQIFDPPLLLYLRGQTSLAGSDAIAVVGARRASSYGIHAAEWLSSELAMRGLTIVSGLARGIDAAAHRGALAAQGKTVAVLGNGVDIVYPRENRKLFFQIAEKGCLVSEFPPGFYPAPCNFPIRNRIISGLCHGTVIAEASEFSGSLITARLSLEQGREVFAVPGNITSQKSFGPNFLIKQGAKMVQSPQDILDELPEKFRKQPHHPRRQSAAQEPDPLLEQIPRDSEVTFDRLLERTGIGFSELCARLFELEVNGQVRRLPGNLFVRKLDVR
ncbi:MAG: DNA-protecting protein DprA [Acidobacteria bacterium]|nr:DNA-protecting protein DprA [Acidobacteriota bacterium]